MAYEALELEVYCLLSTMNHSCAASVRLETSSDTGAEVSLKTTRAVQVGLLRCIDLIDLDPGG